MKLARRYGAALAVLALCSAPLVAQGQSVPVFQSGSLATSGGLSKFFRNGTIGDVGGVLGDVNGRGVTPFAIGDSLGLGLCANTAATGGNYRAFCLGHDASGNALLTVDSFGLSQADLHIRLNGTTYAWPGSSNGSVVGPLSSTTNHVALFADTGGQLLKDGGQLVPDVATNADLAAASTVTYPNGVLRLDFSAGLGASPLFYIASNSACTLNTGNGDNGSQVKSSDNKCWLAQFDGAGADIREWGAVADGGTTDNSNAIVASVAWAIANHGRVLLPPGLIGFATQQAWAASGASNWSISGIGPSSGFLYTGVGATGDLISVGSSSGSASQGLVFRDFRVASNTQMTSGSAFHLKQAGHSSLWNVVMDGQEGNGNLWDGLWCDQCDHVDWYEAQSSAQDEGVMVNGGVGAGKLKADFWIIGGKIGPANGKTMAVGVHVGGAFGGFHLIGDVIGNGTNVLIDHALAAEGNREIFLEKGATVDTATTGSNIEINDSDASGAMVQIAG